MEHGRLWYMISEHRTRDNKYNKNDEDNKNKNAPKLGPSLFQGVRDFEGLQ